MTPAIEYGTAIIMGTSAALIQAGVILCVCMCICTCIYEYIHVYVPSDFLTMLCKFWFKPMSHNGPVELLANRVSEKVV